jgi:hypothetical protein
MEFLIRSGIGQGYWQYLHDVLAPEERDRFLYGMLLPLGLKSIRSDLSFGSPAADLGHASVVRSTSVS